MVCFIYVYFYVFFEYLSLFSTIHQPRSTIYELFDQLMILSQGRTVYFGPASTAVDYFSRYNFHCGQFINPADYFSKYNESSKLLNMYLFLYLVDITIMNEELSKKESSRLLVENNSVEQKNNVDFPKLYSKSNLNDECKQIIKEETENFKTNPINPSADVREYATSVFKQSWVVSKRTFLQIARDPMVTFAQLGQTLFIALLVATLYWQIENNQGSIQDRVGVLFFVMTNQAFAMIISLHMCMYILKINDSISILMIL